jgi:hypothetical protein
MDYIGQGRPQEADSWAWPAESVLLEALTQFIRPESVQQVLEQTGRQSQRIRRLSAAAVLWLVIAMALWTHRDIPSVWRRLYGALRTLWLLDHGRKPPVKSAFCKARKRLGVAPLRVLFAQTATPMATEARFPDAFYKGMPLMAIDGTKLTVPDTAANASAFGRDRTVRNGKPVEAAYPQLRLVLLEEAGTHMIQGVRIRPGRRNEYPVAAALLRSAPVGSLVLADIGFYGYALLAQASQQRKHMLVRAKKGVRLPRLTPLADGSYLTRIYPSAEDRRAGRNGLVLRVIEYTLNDPHRVGHRQRHWLVTTLLDANKYPAIELVVLYHQRWEIEITNDELKTHQLDRLVHIRSRTPAGVLQEVYGVLLAYNAVRALMAEAAACAQVDPRRLSFVHAVRVILDVIPILHLAAWGMLRRAGRTGSLRQLYRDMIQLIAEGRLPPRDGRINPRVVKRKMSKFAKKRPKHCHVPKPAKPFEKVVVVLK